MTIYPTTPWHKRSYDRFFPNQDTLPKGGFGNLIALPLHIAERGDIDLVERKCDFDQFSWALYLHLCPLIS